MNQPTLDDFRIGDYVRFESGEWAGREGMITTLAPDFLGVTLNHTIETRQFRPNELTILHGAVDWCEGCHTRQPTIAPDEQVHIVCWECGHVYKTTQALIDAHNKVNAEIAECHPEWNTPGMETDASNIAACPCCTHDF